MSAFAINLSQHDSHDFSKSNIIFHTRPVYYNTHMLYSPSTFLLSTITTNLWHFEWTRCFVNHTHNI